MPERPRIGEVFEFSTPCGRGYFQVANEHPDYGSLIRVLPGFFDDSDADLAAVVAGPDRFLAFYPVSAGARAGLVSRVGKLDVPDAAQKFPLMRWPLGGDGHRNGWVLWDGSREVGKLRVLGEEHKNLPEPGIWNHQLLVDRTASDWSWADAAEPPPWRPLRRPPACDEPQADQGLDGEPRGFATHYLYLPDSASATRARDRLSSLPGSIDIRPSAVGGRPLLLLRHDPEIDPESLRSDMEQLARDLGGEYDGWEGPAERPGSKPS